MDKKEKEILYNKLMYILQLMEEREISTARSHLEEIIHRLQFNKI
jgi:hypothetical protein